MREGILFAAAFLALAGAAGCSRILYAPEGWAHRFAAAYLLASVLFLVQALRKESAYWDPLRSGLAALACLLWTVYLFVWGFNFAYWILDLLFFILAMLLWLGRKYSIPLIGSLGIIFLIGIRHCGNPAVIAVLDLLLFGVVFHRAAHWIDRRSLRSRGKVRDPKRAGAMPNPDSRRRKIFWRISQAVSALAVFAFLMIHAARPVSLMVSPAKRRLLLEQLAPGFPIQDPAGLTPLAAKLREHVAALAGDIGERATYGPAQQEKAKEYIVARLEEMGYSPEALEYRPVREKGFKRRVPYYNIEAVLPAGTGAAAPVWVVGAHYDSAPGTPGADDNASGVAVLLEAARLLKEKAPVRGIRFVAFGSEEPPSFATRDMGSFRYAKRLRKQETDVHGLLNLEMLGYFNPKPGAQLYPPFLALFYPDTGDSVGLVSNLSSWGLLNSVLKSWRDGSDFPIHGAVLPSAFSTVAISDQLNFWPEGFRAVMLSDTSFFRNPYYHQAGDTPEKLDYERMAEVTRAVVHVLGRT